MNRSLKKLDYLIAVGVGVFIACLAFLWAYPYPHPDLWPLISDLRFHVNLTALAVLGRLGLGLLAGATYIVLRIVWLLCLVETDEFPDRFVFNQLLPLVGSVMFVMTPAVWRSAQYLSPDYLFLLVEMCTVMVWLMSRGFLSIFAYSGSYLVLGFVAGMNPFGCVILLFAAVSDVIARWQSSQVSAQREEIEAGIVSRQQEFVFSVSTATIGLCLGAFTLSRFALLHDFSWDVPRIFFTWLSAWASSFGRMVSSPFLLTVAGAIIAAAVGMAFGRRIRSVGEAGRTMAWFMSVLVMLVALFIFCRANDGDARRRLALIKSFVQAVVDDTKDVKWFFSDGRFDDVLRYEFAKSGSRLTILDVMNLPSEDEEIALRRKAPEVGDRDLFSAGGAEVFRAWARERPDRLAESAWFLGGGILRQFGKTEQRACGTVLRSKPNEGEESRFAAANARQEQLFAEVQEFACRGTRWSHAFGGVDQALREKFDALLWRVGRQTNVRAEECAAVGELKRAQEMRDNIQKINEANATLRRQGSVLERMLPTANLVVTPREGLEIGLKRADFVLAQRYAQKVLVGAPEDPAAHFALGMVNLEFKNYGVAARHFETSLKKRPNEPAALNNLSLCYLKLGRLDAAKTCVEKAYKFNPNSPEIKRNLSEIRKARKEG